MKIVQKILLLGLLVAMQSFALQTMNSINDLTDSLESLSPAISKGHVRLVFENFYEEDKEEVIGVEESKQEESENYVKVNFYQDVPYDVALLSGYIKGTLDFKAAQAFGYIKGALDFKAAQALDTVSIITEITQDDWQEIYHLLTKAYDVNSRLEETKSMMKEDKYEYNDIDFDADFDVTSYMYLYMQERYKNEETNFFVSMFDLVTSLDIPLIEKPLHFLIFNECCDRGQSPIEIGRYETLTCRLNEFNEAIDQRQSLEVLVNKKLLPQMLLPKGKLNQIRSFKLKQLIEHFNHPMIKQFKHVRIKLLKKYIPNMREYITTQKAAGTLPPLAQLIKDYAAQPGEYMYIALFILYCLAHTEQELAKKTGLESLTHGKTLFKVAERIKRFDRIKRFIFDDNCLELYVISDIGGILENLLDILQSLTKKAIKKLDLSDNNLTYMPENISNLSYLTLLDISHNNLTVLPESIFNLTNLEQLDISKNNLTVLPKSIFNLSYLTFLDLSKNNLTALPESISNLTNLEQLDISHNNLIALPESISNLTNLNWFDLSHNNLTALPESISNLTNLNWFDLSHNNLTALPKNISNLTKLECLNLSNNKFKEFPESIFNLIKLYELDLSDNELIIIPEKIIDLPILRFYLGNNKFKEFPESILNLTKLKRLDISRNNFDEIPESISSLTKLEQLDISYNHLTVLPESIFNLTNLEELDISYNDSLSRLQTKIFDLTKLKMLFTCLDMLDFFNKVKCKGKFNTSWYRSLDYKKPKFTIRHTKCKVRFL